MTSFIDFDQEHLSQPDIDLENDLVIDDFMFSDVHLKSQQKQDSQNTFATVVSLLENRTREVSLFFHMLLSFFLQIGVALYESDYARITLMEYSDTQTYSTTVMQLNTIQPTVVCLSPFNHYLLRYISRLLYHLMLWDYHLRDS